MTTAASKDPLTLLTINELDIASHKIGCDVITAIASDGGHPSRWKALATCAWLLAKREDQTAKLDAYLAMSMPQIVELLGSDDDQEVDEDAPLDRESSPS